MTHPVFMYRMAARQTDRQKNTEEKTNTQTYFIIINEQMNFLWSFLFRTTTHDKLAP